MCKFLRSLKATLTQEDGAVRDTGPLQTITEAKIINCLQQTQVPLDNRAYSISSFTGFWIE